MGYYVSMLLNSFASTLYSIYVLVKHKILMDFYYNVVIKLNEFFHPLGPIPVDLDQIFYT